jgi:hypothetical protein
MGASSIDRHVCVFSGERHHVIRTWVFIEFYILGEGPRDHEALHYVIVLKIVHDEGMRGLGRPPRLALVNVHSGRNTPHVGAACLLIIVIIMVMCRTPV